MIDCGENTYMNWKNEGYEWERLKIILITHMHFDHIGGLIPLLFYRKIEKVKGQILIIGPKQLKELITLSFQYQKIDIKKYIKFSNVEDINTFRFDSSSIYIKAKNAVYRNEISFKKNNIIKNLNKKIKKIKIKEIKIR